jgi:hypothetical protein
MNFIMNKSYYDNNNIYIMDGVINNVIENGLFHRLIYSNSIMTLNALIFKYTFNNVVLIKNFNKYKFTYPDDINNSKNINEIKNVELNIINKFNLKSSKKYCIRESITIDNIKLYSEKELNNNYEKIDVYLKISGIWVNDNEYGLTFKFSC